MKHLLILLLLAGLTSCGQRTTVSTASRSLRSAVFLPATPPSGIEPDELRAYMQAHYWDKFNFSDTLFLSRIDTLQMIEAFAGYVALYVDATDPHPIERLMHKASGSRPMLEYFGMLAERVLYDPNSPLRNDELYIPVLQIIIRSPWFDAWERLAPEHDLQLAMQNRVGQVANDFRYRLASGDCGSLYGIHADYTLLFITNPECPMCRDLKLQIMDSPMLSLMIERGELEVLTIYPDEEVELWREHVSQMPTSWINGYDQECVIRKQGLYDLKAIPALYLLDHNKRVLLKDSVSVPDVEQKIDSML